MKVIVKGYDSLLTSELLHNEVLETAFILGLAFFSKSSAHLPSLNALPSPTVQGVSYPFHSWVQWGKYTKSLWYQTSMLVMFKGLCTKLQVIQLPPMTFDKCENKILMLITYLWASICKFPSLI